MTNQPTIRPRPDFGKRPYTMGRQSDDPEKELRIQYNLNLRHREDDAGLWNFEARGYANVWLERNSCISPPKKGEIILGVEKLNHPHTQDGFLTYMADIRREWEATKELARTVNAKPRTDPFGKPIDPVKVAMRNHVNAARGNENDYDWRADANDYDTERNKYMNVNTEPIVKAAITQGTDDPTPTPSPDEPSALVAHFGPKEKPSALPTDGHWSEHGGVALFWATVFNQNEVDRGEEPEARRVIIAVLGSKPNEWPDYDDSLKQSEDAIYAMRINRITATKPAATKEPSNKAADDSVGSVEPPIANEPIQPPKKGQETVSEKPAAKVDTDGVIATPEKIDKAQFRKERNIKIQGQTYLKAGDRVVLFRADHPGWAVETEAIQLSPEFAVFKATVKDDTGKLLATAHGYCTPSLAQKVSGRFVEKAETAAVARVLAFVGYGTDDSLDDSDYISDSPVKAVA